MDKYDREPKYDDYSIETNSITTDKLYAAVQLLSSIMINNSIDTQAILQLLCAHDITNKAEVDAIRSVVYNNSKNIRRVAEVFDGLMTEYESNRAIREKEMADEELLEKAVMHPSSLTEEERARSKELLDKLTEALGKKAKERNKDNG